MADQKSFVATLYQYLDRLEFILVVVAGASLLALYGGIAVANQGIMFSLSGLAGVYFLNAHKPPSQVQEGEKKDFVALLSQTILPKVMWIGCAVGIIGLLFYLLKLEGFREMLTIGGAASGLGVVLFGVLSLVNANQMQTLSPVLYRAIPIVLLTSYVLFGVAG
jgi:hypothetical protein